jgi:hypothetical protein
MSGLLNFATFAGLFSAVTATTMQMSYLENRTLLEKGVNACYSASLIFSFAAAANSLLGVSWRQAI